MPGPAALAEVLATLWDNQTRHDRMAVELKTAGKLAEANAHSIAADQCSDQALKLDLWMMVATVTTPADAVAQLMVIHAKIEALACDDDGDDRRQIRSLLDAAVYSLRVLARQAGFDLARLGQNHLSPDQLAIACGGVAA